jgi:hypothetical protein
MRYRLSLFLALISSVAMGGLSVRAYAQASPAPAAAAVAVPSAPVTADGEAPGTQVQVKALKRVGGDSLMLELSLPTARKRFAESNLKARIQTRASVLLD